MRRKREAIAKPDHRPPVAAGDRFARFDDWLLAGVVGLLVATPLVPSESTVHEGSAAPLHLLWLLALFAWAALLVLRPDPQIKFGWTGVAVAALAGWHTLSALIAGMAGNGRQALNMLWQMICYAVAAFLLRQLLRTPAQGRALIAVMIAVAALESAQGYYEYFISKPAALAEFQKNPDKAYQELGTATDSQRQHFRWRIESAEPLGTFALTNSLAGLLAPWLIALLGIGLTTLGGRELLRLLAVVGIVGAPVAGYSYLSKDFAALFLAPWLMALAAIVLATRDGRELLRQRVGVVVVGALIAGCLLLTKSRTGILAALGGTVLLALYGTQDGVVGRWIGWKIPASVAGVLVLIGLVVVGVGGLETQLVNDALTSLLYRVQYWRSTAAIIADYPLFGCGPGQFQEAYATYKLPQASETPRDPHNFLLEIWSTAGTPALVALLAMAVAFAWQLAAARPPPEEIEDRAIASRVMLYAGGLLGLLLAYPLGLVAGYPPQIGIWIVGLPAAAACVWLLDTWVAHGRLPTSVPVVALIVLLVNLLAAGATSFPGVFMTAWLLVPLTLAQANAPTWTWPASKLTALGVMVGAMILASVCMRTEVSPVLTAPNRVAAAEELARAGRIDAARRELLLAAADDPWSPQPRRHLAYLELRAWTDSRQPEDWKRFLAAAEAYRASDPKHHLQHTDRGHWLLDAWRQSGDPAHLEAAIAAYQQAVLWYPGQALARAQLAWALHLAGRQSDAESAAEQAQRLDSLNPHRELKLSNQTVYDPQLGAAGKSPTHRNAEQVVNELRNRPRTGAKPENSP